MRRRYGQVQSRLRVRPVVWLERRNLIALTLSRRHVVETHARIQREIPSRTPAVLCVPFGEKELPVRRRMPVGFRVLGDGAEQRVGKTDIGIPRVLRVAVEAVVAVEARRLRAAGLVVCSTNRPVLIVCAPFIFVMFPETLKSVFFTQEWEPLLDAERRNRSGRAAREGGLRKNVERIGFGKELRHPRQHDTAVVRIPRDLIERARVPMRPVHADRELAEQRRTQRVQHGVHVADSVDLVLGRHLRPAA